MSDRRLEHAFDARIFEAGINPVNDLGGQCRRRTIENHRAALQPYDPLGELDRVIDLMQVADHGDVLVLADALEIAEHDPRGFRIEARDRLIRQDHDRLLRERAGDAGALLFAA